MIRKSLIVCLGILASVSNLHAEEINLCKAAEAQFTAVALDLFQSGKVPDKNQISELQDGIYFVQKLVDENKEGCPTMLVEQMRKFLNEIKS